MAIDPAPSLARPAAVRLAAEPPAGYPLGRFVQPSELDGPGFDRAGLAGHGFEAAASSAIALWPGSGDAVVLGGTGGAAGLDVIRETAAAIARAAGRTERLAVVLPSVPGEPAARVAEAVVEGALLGRYSYDALREKPRRVPVTDLVLVTSAPDAETGAERGRVLAGVTALNRDLVNTPHNHLTASLLADFASGYGTARGLQVEVFGMEELRELRLGGLLGVNAGSTEPARMVKLTYRPDGEPTARIALVGKGITYDAGGISLKPSDGTHAQMKNDMSGAAAILAAMGALPGLGCSVEVTGYLMCTNNMPSGSATALGDVLTMRNGRTVEVIDTDAEGRLVMADAIALAAESRPDAIVDIATLTGSVSRALGPDVAGVLGNDQAVIDKVVAAGLAAGEPVWQLPLHKPYLRMLESDTADLANCAPIGLPDGILAALFLDEFTDGVPWAHIDIAGTAQAATAHAVKVPGGSGFGARLLAQLLS